MVTLAVTAMVVVVMRFVMLSQDHGHPACDRDGGSIGCIDDSIGCDCDVNGLVMLMIVVLL